MLGQVANYCPVLFGDTIVKNSTSIQAVWQAIRTHFGFQSTGAHFLDFDAIQLEPGERPEDLFNVSQVLSRTTCSNTEVAIPTMVRYRRQMRTGALPLTQEPDNFDMAAPNTQGPTIPCKTKIWTRPSSQNTGQLKARNCLTVLWMKSEQIMTQRC